MGENQKVKLEAKLDRYLRNSNPFLWGLYAWSTQKEFYYLLYHWMKSKNWIKENDFAFNNNKSYRFVTDELLKKYGIDRLICELIIPRVAELFPTDILTELGKYWRTGKLPGYGFIEINREAFTRQTIIGVEGKERKIVTASPFIEVNHPHQLVIKWEEFAGLWFEEIELYLE